MEARSRNREGNIPISESAAQEEPWTHHIALENLTAFERKDESPTELYSVISPTPPL